MVAIYTATIFLSALLLFLVQPMFAKMMLPLLGGSPSVWNTALVFYQAALLAGYAYAHFATRWAGIRRQAMIHIPLLAVPLIVLPIHLSSTHPPVETTPIPWLLLTMLVSVGLPFFLLSASSPLIQRWFADTEHKRSHDPYFLYVASNFGSFLALISYPTVMESKLGLLLQSHVWSWAYGGYAIMMAICAVQVIRSRPSEHPAVVEESDEPRMQPPSLRRRLRWVALAFIPSSLMIGTTTYLTTDIASIPLLWVIPLAIYLLSFMYTFSARPPIPHKWMVYLLPALVLPTMIIFIIPVTNPAIPIGLLCLGTLFVAAMVFHGELALDRPSADHLTEFFLFISLGGVLGGLFAAILAPLLFVLVIEYPLTMVMAGFLLPRWRRSSPSTIGRVLDIAWPIAVALLTIGTIAYSREPREFSSVLTKNLITFCLPAALCFVAAMRPIRFGLCLVALLIVGVINQDPLEHVIYQDRSFFGVLRVLEDKTHAMRRLRHGTTTHGVQLLAEGNRDLPTSYYFSTGPIGQVIVDRGLPEDASVAVVGLGVGSLISYAKSGQQWTFYEIDPAVVKVAENKNLFTFLSDSLVKPKIVLGDGRLSLSRTDDQYDLLIVDAYSSDAIPIHMMTREALRIYFDRLKPGGVLALHLSNRNIFLEPITGALADDAHVACLVESDEPTLVESLLAKTSSTWAILARDQADFGKLGEDSRWKPARILEGTPVWTDDYSNVFSALNIHW